jgi:hypothetical protein
MTKSRRAFVRDIPLGLLAAGAAAGEQVDQPPPGAPPAFNTSTAVGPTVSPATLAEAEKLVQVSMTRPHRAIAAESWRTSMAALYERRTGPHKVAIEPEIAPWSQWSATPPGVRTGPAQNQFVRTTIDPAALPSRDEDIAYATVAQLSRWIEKRQLTSERLTNYFPAQN